MLIISTLFLLFVSTWAQGDKDLVQNLPGLTFSTNYRSYSGYLNANLAGSWKMHYFLVESKSNPSTDPILVWLNGGPGCSSFGGLFEELGPFYVNYDGETLFENPYAWNAKANVLAIESPIGVGFSYDVSTDNFTSANDDQTRDQNYQALKYFFSTAQPQYKNRTFFLSGESYAGIYIPMLSQRLVDGINSGDFPNSYFQGAAIGNGFMHVQYLMNSLVVWSAYHGRISPDKWDRAKIVCQTGNITDHEYYNYQQFMTSTNGMDYYPDNNTECGKIIQQLITDEPAGKSVDFDQYNFFQDCYQIQQKSSTGQRLAVGSYQSLNKNTAVLTNYDSTDNQWGYPCWNDVPVKKYLNRKDVQAALNIDAKWQQRFNGNNTWRDCNDPLYDLYNLTYPTMNDQFKHVINNVKTPNFRFLIYNGDVDTVCNYLGDSWFIRDVANENNLTSSGRNPWLFGNQLAGFVEKYTAGNGVTLDVLTVKGAGHFVPNDRPGPSVQMITNFMFSSKNIDYSSTNFVANAPKLSPLLETGASNGFTNVFAMVLLMMVIHRLF